MNILRPMVLPWRPGTSGASQYGGRTKPSYPVGIYNILFFMKTWRKFFKKILVERKIKERERCCLLIWRTILNALTFDYIIFFYVRYWSTTNRQKKHVTLIQYHIVINGFTPNWKVLYVYLSLIIYKRSISYLLNYW